MPDFTTMLAEAKRPERTVLVCLRGDLAAAHEDLERQLELALKKPDTGKESGGVGELMDRIAALEEEMRGHSYTFRLRALPRHEFRALVHAYPPREDENGERLKEDAAMGVNRDDFFPALIRVVVYDPTPTDAEWADLLDDKLTEYQFQELAWACWRLNDGEVNVPFSRAVSQALRASADA